MEKTIHQQMIDAGILCQGHYSDLYVPCNPITAKILEDNGLLHTETVSRFVNQIEGAVWYDVAFHWDSKASTNNNKAEV